MALCDRKGGKGLKVLKKRDIINEWPLTALSSKFTNFFYFMPRPAISRQRHSVVRLSVRACVRDHIIEIC